MFANMKLVGEWLPAKFLSEVHEDNNDVNFGLWKVVKIPTLYCQLSILAQFCEVINVMLR